MRSTRLRLIAAGILPLALLTACGDDEGGQASSSSATKPSTPQTVAPDKITPISDVAVNTSKPAAPSVSLSSKPFSVNATTTKVTKPGSGAKVTDKDIAYVSYVAVNGTSGKTIESTFGKPSAAFNLSSKNTFPGLLKALKGQKVGSELVVAVPPAEGFGGQGQPELGITAKDTMVFYLKVNSAYPLLTQVSGTQAPSQAGLPTVSVPAGYKTPATITVPKGAKAPTALKAQTLIKGTGPKVAAGQQLIAHYTGQVWGGKIFDSTGAVPGQPANPQKVPGQPAQFPIGVGKVVPGWDKALVGQTVGSRVLLSIPPADGYGKQGYPQGGIKGTDTLVFVVDIMGAL